MNKNIKFKIHRIDWEVELVDPDTFEDQRVGECEYSFYTIRISNILKKSQMKSVLIHEVTHAFRWTYGLVSELELSNIPTSELEEQIANTVEVFGYDILCCVDSIMTSLERKKLI